ncbi:MAG: thioredoxin family protein [Acidimicrobiia bacterium]|nr:thioredoxin family protein [Acidimicrobiia bacterium]
MSRTRSLVVGGLTALLVTAMIVALPPAAPAATESAVSAEELWYPRADDGSKDIALYFVYSETCPHCTDAKPVVDQLEGDYSWLAVRRVSTEEATEQQIDEVLAVAEDISAEIQGVPTFLFCERIEVGFHTAETTGAHLEEALVACHRALVGSSGEGSGADAGGEEDNDDGLHLPVLGDVDANAVSLPVFTIAVAGLDAFNPCAFFVLLFLLSLLVHARSRWRMALVGGVFVLISGVMYFAFMAAWLTVFQVTGRMRWVTMVAGAVAILLAVLNMKDFFWPDSAGSVSIPDSAKPGLFARMRRLTTGDSMPTVLVGTVALAAVANSYELLCTAGFPLVFTRVLTLNDLATPTYYGYLALYNVIYVIPLLIIVGVFVWSLGSRKLSEAEGRFLKLMSGAMMLGLGGILLINPDLLENMLVAISIMAGALLAAVVVMLVDRRHRGGRGAHLKAG